MDLNGEKRITLECEVLPYGYAEQIRINIESYFPEMVRLKMRQLEETTDKLRQFDKSVQLCRLLLITASFSLMFAAYW